VGKLNKTKQLAKTYTPTASGWIWFKLVDLHQRFKLQ